MAPARKRRKTKGVIDITNLKLDDVMCPICRSIIVEPVSMPCEHSLCYFCFDKTIENNTLTCPVCRTRIGSWLRSATRSKSIINQQFWAEIQKQFPKELECKQAGEDDGVEENVIGCRMVASISNPGEIGQEFKEQLNQFSVQEREEQEKQEKASAELAKKLMEEELRAKSEWLLSQQKVVEKDAELAKSLALEENEGKILETGSEIIPKDGASKDLNVTEGPSSSTGGSNFKSNGSTTSSNSSRCNSIDEEFRHFTPIIPNRNSKNRPQKSDVTTKLDCAPIFKNVELVRPIKPDNVLNSETNFEKPQGPHRLHVLQHDEKVKSNAFLRVRRKSQDREGSADSSDTDFENDTPIDKISAEGSTSQTNMAPKGSVPQTKLSPDESMLQSEGSLFEDGPDATAIHQAPASSNMDTTSAVVKSVLFDELSIIPDVTMGAVTDVEKIYSELEKRTMERIRQEEEDRKFALQMQEMWEKDERQKACKVTSDYKLRRKNSVATAKRTVTVTPKVTVTVPRQTTLDKHLHQVRS